MALGKGGSALEKIKDGTMVDEGRGAIVFGMVSGVLGLIVNICALIYQCSNHQI